jgi:hypothetical protein
MQSNFTSLFTSTIAYLANGVRGHFTEDFVSSQAAVVSYARLLLRLSLTDTNGA